MSVDCDELVLAKKMTDKHKEWAKALGAQHKADYDRGIAHHHTRARLRAAAQISGEKTTESKLEDDSRIDPAHVAAMHDHAAAITACETARAEYLLAKAEFDIAMAKRA